MSIAYIKILLFYFYAKGFGPTILTFLLGRSVNVLTFCSNYDLHRSVDKQVGGSFSACFETFPKNLAEEGLQLLCLYGLVVFDDIVSEWKDIVR